MAWRLGRPPGPCGHPDIKLVSKLTFGHANMPGASRHLNDVDENIAPIVKCLKASTNLNAVTENVGYGWIGSGPDVRTLIF